MSAHPILKSLTLAAFATALLAGCAGMDAGEMRSDRDMRPDPLAEERHYQDMIRGQ